MMMVVGRERARVRVMEGDTEWGQEGSVRPVPEMVSGGERLCACLGISREIGAAVSQEGANGPRTTAG